MKTILNLIFHLILRLHKDFVRNNHIEAKPLFLPENEFEMNHDNHFLSIKLHTTFFIQVIKKLGFSTNDDKLNGMNYYGHEEK